MTEQYTPEFEKYAEEEGINNFHFNHCWDAWQASRAAREDHSVQALMHVRSILMDQKQPHLAVRMKDALKALDAAIASENAESVPTELSWTGNTEVDAALVMLDRLDVQGDDDARVDAISNTLRRLAVRDAVPTFQQRVHQWILPCFGAEIAGDTVERNHRFYEESTEYVQSKGMTASECHQLVDYVFGRPIGEPFQEAGGVLVTFAAACNAARIDMNAAGETELARISDPVTMAKIRAKQAAKPKHSPLPEHVPDTSPVASAPVAHFLFDQQSNTWHQVDAGYENDPDVVPLHAPAGWKP